MIDSALPDDGRAGVSMATDPVFQGTMGLPHPPTRGTVTAIDATTGQLTLDIDGAIDALAWPLSGASYAVGDTVFLVFTSPSPGSGVAVGKL